MTTDPVKCGVSYFAKRNRWTGSRGMFGQFRNALVIEENAAAANRLAATLHVLLGYELDVRLAKTLDDSFSLLSAKAPDIVIVGDRPKLAIDALQIIPGLRKSGYAGPIIVVGDQLTRARHEKLRAAGASDSMHRDDVDSVRLAEALSQICAPMINGTAVQTG